MRVHYVQHLRKLNKLRNMDARQKELLLNKPRWTQKHSNKAEKEVVKLRKENATAEVAVWQNIMKPL